MYSTSVSCAGLRPVPQVSLHLLRTYLHPKEETAMASLSFRLEPRVGNLSKGKREEAIIPWEQWRQLRDEMQAEGVYEICTTSRWSTKESRRSGMAD